MHGLGKLTPRSSCAGLARASTSCFPAAKTWMAGTKAGHDDKNQSAAQVPHPAAGLSRPPQLLRVLQIHRDELRYAALGHGDAEQSVHAGHGEAVMVHDEEDRLRRPALLRH